VGMICDFLTPDLLKLINSQQSYRASLSGLTKTYLLCGHDCPRNIKQKLPIVRGVFVVRTFLLTLGEGGDVWNGNGCRVDIVGFICLSNVVLFVYLNLEIVGTVGSGPSRDTVVTCIADQLAGCTWCESGCVPARPDTEAANSEEHTVVFADWCWLVTDVLDSHSKANFITTDW